MEQGKLGPQLTKDDGWTYCWPEEVAELVEVVAAEQPDFRFQPCGLRVLAEHYEEGIGWENFGVFKDEDDLMGEIELSRAEPDPA